MARWTGPRDNREPSGPIYWATGDWYPNHVHHTLPDKIKQQLADLEIVQAAIDREWDRLQIGRQS